MRKREDSSNECSHRVEIDDRKMITEIIKALECIPLYWKRIVKPETQFKECQTPAQYKKSYGLMKKYKSILSSYTRPCVEMTTQTVYYEKDLESDGDTEIKFTYREKYYQEISNYRDFGFESFWSAVGGFIGIFTGYSMLQIPEILGVMQKHFLAVKRKYNFPPFRHNQRNQ